MFNNQVTKSNGIVFRGLANPRPHEKLSSSQENLRVQEASQKSLPIPNTLSHERSSESPRSLYRSFYDETPNVIFQMFGEESFSPKLLRSEKKKEIKPGEQIQAPKYIATSDSKNQVSSILKSNEQEIKENFENRIKKLKAIYDSTLSPPHKQHRVAGGIFLMEDVLPNQIQGT